MTWEWRRGHGCDGGFARGIRAIAEGVGRDTDRRFAKGLAHPPEAALSLAGPGLRCSPPVAALSRLRRTVKVSEGHRLPHARLGRAMLSFTAALPELRGAGLTVASVDGKTMRGVWEDGWRLRLWRVCPGNWPDTAAFPGWRRW